MWAVSSTARPRLGGPVTRTTSATLCPLSWQLSCTNSSMSSLQPRLPWVRGQPGQPTFTSLKVSTRYLQASPQHPWIQHYAGWVRLHPAPQAKHFASCSLVSYVQRRNEDTGLRSLARHWRFQRRWNSPKFHLKDLKSVTVLPLPS